MQRTRCPLLPIRAGNPLRRGLVRGHEGFGNGLGKKRTRISVTRGRIAPLRSIAPGPGPNLSGRSDRFEGHTPTHRLKERLDFACGRALLKRICALDPCSNRHDLSRIRVAPRIGSHLPPERKPHSTHANQAMRGPRHHKIDLTLWRRTRKREIDQMSQRIKSSSNVVEYETRIDLRAQSLF